MAEVKTYTDADGEVKVSIKYLTVEEAELMETACIRLSESPGSDIPEKTREVFRGIAMKLDKQIPR